MVKSFSLLEYFPDRWRSLKEVQAICDSDVNPVDGEDLHTIPHLWDCMDADLNNVFINPYGEKPGADEYACSRWESIMGIVPANDATLEERQFAISTKLFQGLPYTHKALEKMLTDLLGEGNFLIISGKSSVGLYKFTHDELSQYEHDKIKFEVGRTPYKTLTVKLSLESRFMVDAVTEMLDRIVPADMILNITVAYTTYDDMSEYTHDDLTIYTNDEIKVTEM